MSASQRGLARRLGVDQSVLSRFLSQQPGYEPARNRPRILKLLEDVEQVCSHLENVVPYQDDEPFDATDDLGRWEDALIARLRVVRQDKDPGRALTRFPELSVQALHFPGRGRAFNCINACLAASLQLIAEWRSGVCSDRLVKETVDRVYALEQAALEALPLAELGPDDHQRHLARCRSYAGQSLCFAGLRLGDDQLIAEGIERQLEAAAQPSEPKDGVWHNLLGVINIMLERGVADASVAAARAAEVGRECENRCLPLALADRELTSLVACWADIAPDLLDAEER